MKKSRHRIRDRGSFCDFLIQCMMFLFICVIIVACFDYLDIVSTKQSCGQIARSYMLRMESTGYLTTEDLARMKAELTELGVTDISTTGTTTAPAQYGEIITLRFSCKYEGYTINEKRISTSKR